MFADRISTMRFKRLRRAPTSLAAAYVELKTNSLQYPPLEAAKSQIRLLTWDLDENDEIQCHLTVLSLDNKPVYTALSYVWGTQAPAHCIQVNGRPFWVRATLYDFLLRTAREETIGRGMFVDFICINQNDMAETSSQVALMGSVYSYATEVTVWLGDEKGWASNLADRFPALRDAAILQSCLLTATGTDLFSAQEIDGIQLDVYLNIACNAYWSRVWTVQEYQLPERIVLRIGDLRLNSAANCIYALFTNRLGTDLAQDMLETSVPWGVFFASAKNRKLREYHRSIAVVASRALRESRAGSERALPLYRAVMTFSEQECLVVEDHIFGLLGLCKSVMVPEYNLPLLSLYTRALLEGLTEILLCADLSARNRMATTASFIAALCSSLDLRLEVNTAVMIVTVLALLQTNPNTTFVMLRNAMHTRSSNLRYANLGRLYHCYTKCVWGVAWLEAHSTMRSFERVSRNGAFVLGPEGELFSFTECSNLVAEVSVGFGQPSGKDHCERHNPSV
ncbi:hypothetical protein LTS10_010546 [Elasticomyces elasticus]|nr:hypothetical protein LTS10_010546 [Elasticomyces elasticus]